MEFNISSVAGPADGLGTANASFQNEYTDREDIPLFINAESRPDPQSSPTNVPINEEDGTGFFKRARFYEAKANQEGDEVLLHPPPKELTMYKHERARLLSKCKGQQWKAGDTIRLLPELAHMKTDPQKGIDIDLSLPLPPDPPKRLVLLPQFQMIKAGVTFLDPSEGISKQDFDRDRWAYASPIYIRVLAKGRHPPEFYFVDSWDHIVEPLDKSKTLWDFGFESGEKRAARAGRLYFKVKYQMQVADKLFRDAAKKYRVGRLLWEIKVVKHQFLILNKKRLFHPGLRKVWLRRVIKDGRKDIKKEDEGSQGLQKRGWELVTGVDGRQIAQRKNR